MFKNSLDDFCRQVFWFKYFKNNSSKNNKARSGGTCLYFKHVGGRDRCIPRVSGQLSMHSEALSPKEEILVRWLGGRYHQI